MKKSFIEFYALSVCFASTIFLIVSGAICLYELTRVVQPAMTIDSYTYRQSLSDEMFLKAWPKETPIPDPDTRARLRKESFDVAIQSEQRSGLNTFMNSLTYVITAGLFFGLHWKLAHREQPGAAASPA